MMVRATGAEEFFRTFPIPDNAYGSEGFYAVTPVKDNLVRFFIGYSKSRPNFGLIAGMRHGVWYAPYSAPFTDIFTPSEYSIEDFYDFICEVRNIIDAPIHITTAPEYYGHGTGAKITCVLGNMASRCIFDYDYWFGCERFAHYRDYISHAARKNLARAEKQGFEFIKTDDIDRAYAVILANRQSHQYPLAMSLNRVKDTVAEIPADFFLLTLGDNDVAAAMVYHVADTIAQVIYWGDAPGYSHLRPMNLLAYKIFEYYTAAGFLVVDLGPSSSNGIPSPGLCRFKESIGCITAVRHTFII